MDIAEFESRVLSQAGPELKAAHDVLLAALYKVARESGPLAPKPAPFMDWHVRRVIEEASEVLANRAADEPTSYAEHPTERSEQGIKHDYRAHEMLAELRPWVERLRLERFEQAAPPFNTLEAAAAHLEEHHAGPLNLDREVIEYVGGRVVRQRNYSVPLHYIKPGHDMRQSVMTEPESYWERLAKEAGRVAGETGFLEQNLVAHVLTGIEIPLPRAQIRETTRYYTLASADEVRSRDLPGLECERKSVTILYNAADLTRRETRGHYNAVREHFATKHADPFTPAERDFLNLFKEMGGPPPKNGGVEFYKRLCQRWNREFAGKSKDHSSYKWDSLRTKYQRLKDRL